MPTFKSLVFLASLALGGVLPRSPDKDTPEGYCCFTLHDASNGDIVQQNQKEGSMFLNSDQPDGWYCFNFSDTRGVLVDDWYNACIITTTDYFTCLDQTLGGIVWGLESDDSPLLTHDGRLDFNACEQESGGELLYGDKTTGCRTLQLEAKGFVGACKGFAS